MTANYFNQYYYEPAGVTVNSNVRDYNYDLWAGIEYKLDDTKPVGQRVVELKLNGQPLAMDLFKSDTDTEVIVQLVERYLSQPRMA